MAKGPDKRMRSRTRMKTVSNAAFGGLTKVMKDYGFQRKKGRLKREQDQRGTR